MQYATPLEVEGTVLNRPVDWKETAKGVAARAAGGVAQVLIDEEQSH